MELHHLAFRVENLDRSREFYCGLLGFAVVRDQAPRSLWLDLGERAVLMLEARQVGEPPYPPASLELAAFRVTPGERIRLRTLARERGCFDGETEHTIYLRDPDGRRVGVSSYSY